jgi:hypothetical protein
MDTDDQTIDDVDVTPEDSALMADADAESMGVGGGYYVGATDDQGNIEGNPNVTIAEGLGPGGGTVGPGGGGLDSSDIGSGEGDIGRDTATGGIAGDIGGGSGGVSSGDIGGVAFRGDRPGSDSRGVHADELES